MLVQRRDGSGFTGEALAELRVGYFDGDVAAEAVVVRTVHLSHPTFADEREDFIRAELIAWGEGLLNDSTQVTP